MTLSRALGKMEIDTYLAKVVVGNQDLPGAPLLHVAALVVVPTGLISGHARITQALPPPNDDVHINNLTGSIHALGFGGGLRVVTLKGTYLQTFPPPAIGEVLEQFSAVLILQTDEWDGVGGFTYGTNHVDDVPVKHV